MNGTEEQIEFLSNVVLLMSAGLVLAAVVSLWFVVKTWDDPEYICETCRYRDYCKSIEVENG